jgi:hypothetical protein
MTVSERLLKQLPTRRLKAVDGMAVTATVWEEVSDYHRLYRQMATLLAAGTGVISGLEVVASDPADRTVYVTPGVAVDHEGRLVVFTDTVAYDVGNRAEGVYRLILHYAEGRPTVTGADSDDPQFIQHQFELEAKPVNQTTEGLELARFDLSGQSTPIRNPAAKDAPHANEIDVRFRTIPGKKIIPTAHVGVLYLGSFQETTHRTGWQHFSRTINQQGKVRLYLDDNVTLSGTLPAYSLLYVTAEQSFNLSGIELEWLYGYWKNGGYLWIEPCHRNLSRGGAVAAFEDLFSTFGFTLHAVPRRHELFQQPHMFAAPPSGYVMTNESLRVGDRILYSPFDYGCLWQGEQDNALPSRESIRAAYEFGENLLKFILKIG